MGENQSQTRRRVTVPDAARLLGISVEAVRGRIKRGTLEHEKEEGGTVYVLLDADRAQPVADQSTDQTALELMREMMELTQERLRYLERQVEEEREARRRADMLLAQLVQRIPELEVPAEPPSESSEPPESPTAATEQPGRVEPQPQVEGAQEGTERRSWWRRMFGG